MSLRLRQVALVAHDLAPVEEALATVLGVEACFRDPVVAEFGLHNVLFPIGDTFLEVVSPTEPGTTAGRLLQRRGGDCGYMVLVQTDDLQDARDRIGRGSARIVYTAQGQAICGLHLHPRDLGGAIVSIDEAHPPQAWEWAGPRWMHHVRTDTVSTIDAVQISASDPGAMAARWAQVIGGDVRGTSSGRGGGDVELCFDRGRVRFVSLEDGATEGVSGLDLLAADPQRAGEHHVICGTTIRLV
ncbi:MAG: VOC family protein [Acidimicrobiales bacterium]